jgi:hypothetical protein
LRPGIKRHDRYKENRKFPTHVIFRLVTGNRRLQGGDVNAIAPGLPHQNPLASIFFPIDAGGSNPLLSDRFSSLTTNRHAFSPI